jgi:hypothetical protein
MAAILSALLLSHIRVGFSLSFWMERLSSIWQIAHFWLFGAALALPSV